MKILLSSQPVSHAWWDTGFQFTNSPTVLQKKFSISMFCGKKLTPICAKILTKNKHRSEYTLESEFMY